MTDITKTPRRSLDYIEEVQRYKKLATDAIEGVAFADLQARLDEIGERVRPDSIHDLVDYTRQQICAATEALFGCERFEQDSLIDWFFWSIQGHAWNESTRNVARLLSVDPVAFDDLVDECSEHGCKITDQMLLKLPKASQGCKDYSAATAIVIDRLERKYGAAAGDA